MPNANILVVEDESIIAIDIRNRVLNLGYGVSGAAATGEDAIAIAEETLPDLVLMDIKLRGEMDGVEAASRIRLNLDIPVVYLTAYANASTVERAKFTEPFGYLVKPFELKELLARLCALTRRQSTNTAKTSILAVAELSMDTHTRVVMRGDKLIELTAKEYAVLECLMREPERVLTRTEIAESVWNYDVYNQSNVVDVYIRNLRRKIDDPFEQKLIQTVRGAGYRLSARGE